MSASRAAVCAALAFAATCVGCERGLGDALTRLLEAQKLVADARVQLHRSAEAAQEAIMAETDAGSAGFAREAQESETAIDADLKQLVPLVAQIGSDQEKRLLGEVDTAFGRLRELDRTLLPLALENTNAKAQQLSFGPARDAADALRDHLDRAAAAAPAAVSMRAQWLAARVQLSVREIQVLQAPHIAEADDAVMTRLEQQMTASESTARASLAELAGLLGPRGEPELGAAREQLDRFAQVHQELLKLSRLNSNVHSLAVALGDKVKLTAACDAALAELQEALSKHGLQATR